MGTFLFLGMAAAGLFPSFLFPLPGISFSVLSHSFYLSFPRTVLLLLSSFIISTALLYLSFLFIFSTFLFFPIIKFFLSFSLSCSTLFLICCLYSSVFTLFFFPFQCLFSQLLIFPLFLLVFNSFLLI